MGIERRHRRGAECEQSCRQWTGSLLQPLPCRNPKEQAGGGVEHAPLPLHESVVDPRVEHSQHSGGRLGEPARAPEQDHRGEARQEERADGPETSGPRAAEQLDPCGLEQPDRGAEPASNRSRPGSEDRVDLEEVAILEQRPQADQGEREWNADAPSPGACEA